MIFKAKHIVVLDIGSSSIRAYEGTNGVDGMFNIKSSVELEYDGFYKGEWISEDSLINAIQCIMADMEESSNKIKAIYIGVPGDFITVETKSLTLNFPDYHKIVDKDIDEIYNSGKKFNNDYDNEYISSSAVYFTIDGQKRLIDPRGASANNLELLASYILCKRSFIKLFNNILSQYQGKIEFISSIWAEAFSLIEPDKRDQGVLLCDIGYLTASIMLVRGDGIVEYKTINNGGGFINSDIAKLLKVPYKSAIDIRKMLDLSVNLSEIETIDIDNGMDDLPKAKLAAYVALQRIEDICEDIHNAINGFGQECPTYFKLYLTGGGITDIRGATRIIAERLERSIEVISPSHPQFNNPRFASSVGIMEIAARKEREKLTFVQKIFNK